MKKRITLLALAVSLTVFMLYAAFASQSERELSREMIRLRVIASSDSEEDQALKLRVRDMLLESLGEAGYESRGEALAGLKAEKNDIEDAVNALLEENGADYRACVGIGKVLYPSCTYDTFALPAGEYTALTVTLGEGEGHNWWCVLFPPLCYGAAPEKDAIESSAILWEDEGSIEIKFRFRVLEWIETVKSKF